jgi:hypothetical protein
MAALILALVASAAAYGALQPPAMLGSSAATILWVIALASTVGWAGVVTSALNERGSNWLALFPGGLLLALSIGCAIAVIGSGTEPQMSGMQQFGIAVSIVAALIAVAINIAAAGFLTGISVLFIQVPLALVLAFLFLFSPRSRR